MRINETTTLDNDLVYSQYQEGMKNRIVYGVEESKDVTSQVTDEPKEATKLSISEESLSLLNQMKDDEAKLKEDFEKKKTIKVGEFIGSIDMVYDENTKNLGAQEAYLGPTIVENARVNFTI